MTSINPNRIPLIGTKMKTKEFKFLCFKLAADEGYSVVCYHVVSTRLIRFTCEKSSTTRNDLSTSNSTTGCNYCIELHNEEIATGVNMIHNHSYNEEDKAENREYMTSKAGRYVSSSSNSVNLTEVEDIDTVEDKAMETDSTLSSLSDSEEEEEDEQASPSLSERGIKISDFGKNTSQNDSVLGDQPNSKLDIGTTIELKEQVQLLMQTGSIPLPSVNSQFLASTPKEFRIRASAAAQQRGFTIVKSNHTSIPKKDRNSYFHLFCGKVGYTQCKYRITIKKIMIVEGGKNEEKWKCDEVVGEHNHPMKFKTTKKKENSKIEIVEAFDDSESEEEEVRPSSVLYEASSSKSISKSRTSNEKKTVSNNSHPLKPIKRTTVSVVIPFSKHSSSTKSIPFSNSSSSSFQSSPVKRQKLTEQNHNVRSSTSSTFFSTPPNPSYQLSYPSPQLSTPNYSSSYKPTYQQIPFPASFSNHFPSPLPLPLPSSPPSLQLSSFLHFLSPSLSPYSNQISNLGIIASSTSSTFENLDLINLISMDEFRLKKLLDSITTESGKDGMTEMSKVIFRRKIKEIRSGLFLESC